MNIRLEDQLGEIVAHDYRAAAVFKANGIDFCCRGHRTLREAINEKGLLPDTIVKQLETLNDNVRDTAFDYSKWKLEHLIDHIIETHHAYVRKQIPVISAYLDQICKAHGKTQPELFEIKSLFAEDAHDLMQHMEAEESIVFPMIRDLAVTPLHLSSPSCVPLNFFQKMISAMENDHVNEGIRWKKIEELTENYKLQFGCNVAFVTFSLLHEYQENLHFHIHLENNILFPGALELKNNKIKAIQS